MSSRLNCLPWFLYSDVQQAPHKLSLLISLNHILPSSASRKWHHHLSTQLLNSSFFHSSHQSNSNFCVSQMYLRSAHISPLLQLPPYSMPSSFNSLTIFLFLLLPLQTTLYARARETTAGTVDAYLTSFLPKKLILFWEARDPTKRRTLPASWAATCD